MPYYGVQVGRKPGVYTDWASCNKQVHGFGGAKYKKFPTEKEALDFVRQGNGIISNSRDEIIEDNKGKDITSKGKPELKLEKGKLIAYTDGSFRVSDNSYGYGAVAITPEGEELEFEGRGTNPEVAALRNVSGELLAVINMVEYAIVNGYKQIEVCHDYLGISEWAEGRWKCNITITKRYKELMDKYRSVIKISFIKIKSHSGDYYNNWADRLAAK